MKKLFWDDPYQDTCKAKVVSIDQKRIVLDQTVFYAFSGGQASDKGTIGGIEVVEARKEGDKEDIISITYTLEREPDFKVGDEIEVKIDKEYRLRLMRLHSLAHLLYYFVINKIGKVKIVGSNVAAHKARMDFFYEGKLSEVLLEIESEVNSFIKEGHEIRMEPDLDKPDLRWWVCESWKMPCGGTHVKDSKEIGLVKLKRKTVGKGKERIEMLLV